MDGIPLISKAAFTILDDIGDRFRSGNSIPVDRAYLTRQEWELLHSYLGLMEDYVIAKQQSE